MNHLELVPDPPDELEPGNILIPEMISVEEQPYNFKAEDILATTIHLVPFIIEKAREARYLAESYRGFIVAAAAVAYDPNPLHPRVAILTSGNYKASLPPEDKDEHDVESISKVCAEMDIEIRAANAGYTRISAIAIAATEKRRRIAQVTKVESATLHPCKECGEVMNRSHIYDKDTLLITVGSSRDSRTMQVQTVDEYQERYRNLRAGKPFIDATVRDYSPLGWDRKRDQYSKETKSTVLHRGRLTEATKRKIMTNIVKAA